MLIWSAESSSGGSGVGNGADAGAGRAAAAVALPSIDVRFEDNGVELLRSPR